MSGWAPKRFWAAARAAELPDGGHAVLLDQRQVMTPAKAPMRLPTQALAEAIALEWDAQEKRVDPRKMPLTRAANAAIDKVAVQFDEVAGLIADYGASDHLCYRATGPEALRARQDAAWDPVLAWSADALQAPLLVTAGVIHIAQPAASVATLRRLVFEMDPFALTGLSDLVGLSGSLVLGLAVARGALDPDTAWEICRIDETYQAEVWGQDEDAAAVASHRATDFRHAAKFIALARDPH